MLEPHHFVVQPFRHPFPLLCMLSTPSKYCPVQAFLLKCWIWKCWIPPPKTLCLLLKTSLQFGVSLSSQTFNLSHPKNFTRRTFTFMRFFLTFGLFLAFENLSGGFSFILMLMLSFYSAFEKPLMSFSLTLKFLVAKTSISHPGTVESFMHHLPHVKWISSLGSFVHFWTNETKLAPHLVFCPNLGFVTCVLSIL